MVTYKIYNLPNFEITHSEYFNSLIKIIQDNNMLSSSIDEIIITDDIRDEINRYCEDRIVMPHLTASREYKAIAKTVNFDKSKKVFFDANHVNIFNETCPQIVFQQLFEVLADDIIKNNYPITQSYNASTPLSDVIKTFLSYWGAKVCTVSIDKQFTYKREIIHPDVKIYTNAFKRNIRKLHYQYQADRELNIFWVEILGEVDAFIRRCLDVRFDNGSFDELQEFTDEIPPLLDEIEVQVGNILSKKDIEINIIKKFFLSILKKCHIEIPRESPMHIKITESPKKLFRGNLVDTEPRIVAFVDILGFSAIINEYDSDETSNLLNELHETLELAIKATIELTNDSKAKNDLQEYLEYRMFSDCLCISLPYIEFGNDFHLQFVSIANLIKEYQLLMMTKGFFVRGGISAGSFYADQNMIFSGGLVKAYKLELKAFYPIIIIDSKILERLKVNFKANTSNLFFNKLLIKANNLTDNIFLNPFEGIDNAVNYLSTFQSSIDDIISQNKNDLPDLVNSFLKVTQSITNPIFDQAKSFLSDENINKVKAEVLNNINNQITKYDALTKNKTLTEETLKEYNKILSKYEFMKSFTDWSISNKKSDEFSFFLFN